MNTAKMLGIVLMVLGGLALAYGGFTYTRNTHEAKVGPIELSITDKEAVNIPIGVGAGALIAGAILLAWRRPD